MIRFIGVLLLGLSLLGCEVNEPASEQECYQLPAGSHLPRFTHGEEELNLSYVKTTGVNSSLLLQPIKHPLEKLNVKDSLRSGNDWFINWADFPSVVRFKDLSGNTAQFSHWLQYSGKGTYDYDIYAAVEYFQPENSFKLHQDTASAEHGFLSSAPLPGGGLQVSWLDGRYTKDMGAAAGAAEVEAQGDDHGHGAGGAMTLRTKALTDSVSVELDHRVCDCCNTATIATDSLIMVAYRDRSEHEIRDIGYVTKPIGGDEWSTPKLVHADNWEISGCPVNGPALAANAAGDIATVWYTGANDNARLQFARYDTANNRFTSPTLLDDADPLGRVDIQLAADGTAYVTGLTTKPDTDDAFLTLWTISPNGDLQRKVLSKTSAARSAGFPKIALFDDKLYWARTVVGAEKGERFVEVCWR